jgi:hypothetical protein
MPQTIHVLALAGALCSVAATIFIRQGLRISDPFPGFWINLLSSWTKLISYFPTADPQFLRGTV